MEIFPDRLLSDIERLPGGNHTYLKQLCAPDGAGVRLGLQRLTERLGAPIEDRAADLLSSFDNRKFFQGFAEVVTLGALQGARWRVRALHSPGPRLELRAPGGEAVMLSVLAFLHQTRPGGEEETRRRLAESLSRIRARDRFVVLIRRWLPHDFDPTPVRRAVEMWLGRVAQGEWEGRYAAYDDEFVSLEFCLTRQRTKGRQSPLAEVVGPFLAHRTLEAVEPRVVTEIDRHLGSTLRARPLLLACVTDQRWTLTPGYLRDFLYGRASRMSSGEGPPEVAFNEQTSVSLFRDPLYAGVSGVMFIDRDPARPTFYAARALLNPWATFPIAAAALGVRCFAVDEERSAVESNGRGGRSWVMRWFDELPAEWEIG